jgi:hypothetical protein
VRIEYVIVLFSLVSAAVLFAEEEEPPPPATRRNIIEMRALDAEIAPSWQIILPTGNVEIRTEDQVGGLKLNFQTYFNFIDNTLGAAVIFSYPLWLFEPSLRFYQDVDFEKTVDVGLTGTIVEVNKADRYISRNRGIDAGLYLHPLSWLAFGPFLGIMDSYEGSLESAQVLDDSVYLVPGLGMTVDTVSLSDLEEKIYTGFEMQIRNSWRFRRSFDTPIEWDLHTRMSVLSGWANDLFLNSRIEVGLPLKIWEDSMGSFYSLGGFKSVHGYLPSSIHTFRYAMLNGELKLPALFRQDSEPRNGRERGLYFHRFRLLLLADILAGQSSQALESDISWYAGSSAGISMLISDQRNHHFRTRVYVSVPLRENPAPVLTVETSLFSLGRNL